MKRQAAGQRVKASAQGASAKRVKLQANGAASTAKFHDKEESYKTKSVNGLSNGKPAQNSNKGKQRATEDAVTPAPAQKPAATAFEIVAGSYERILYGLHCILSGKGENASVDMQPIFQFPAHLTCVKACDASPNGRFLVTGATDEVIKLWDLKRRKEVGGLLAHDSDISSLTFSTDKYLVSTSADGTLALFRTKDWSVLRKFKGHKGKVNYVSVHPQGRVALTVGKDRCLRMWDLLGRSTGKSSLSTKLGAEADIVRWNAAGDKFVVVLDREVRIYTTNMKLLHSLTSRSRFHDAVFAVLGGTEVLLVACDDHKVRIYKDISSASPKQTTQGVEAGEEEDSNEDEDEKGTPLTLFAELVGHKNRIKSLRVVTVLDQQLAVTISSDGFIHVYPLPTSLHGTSEEPQAIQQIGTYDTKGTRLTCLTAVAVGDDRTTVASVAGDRSDDEDDDSDSSDDDDELVVPEEVQEVDVESLDGEEAAGASDDDSEVGEDEQEDEDEDDAEEEWGGIADGE